MIYSLFIIYPLFINLSINLSIINYPISIVIHHFAHENENQSPPGATWSQWTPWSSDVMGNPGHGLTNFYKKLPAKNCKQICTWAVKSVQWSMFDADFFSLIYDRICLMMVSLYDHICLFMMFFRYNHGLFMGLVAYLWVICGEFLVHTSGYWPSGDGHRTFLSASKKSSRQGGPKGSGGLLMATRRCGNVVVFQIFFLRSFSWLVFQLYFSESKR